MAAYRHERKSGRRPPAGAAPKRDRGAPSEACGTHIITTKFPDTKVIVLTMHTDETFSDRAHKAGARLFLAKDCGNEKLFRAIKHCSLASE